MHIANTIASQLSATSGDVFSVTIVPPGWIHLELTHSGLAIWLQNLAVRCVAEQGKIKTEAIPKSQNQNPAIVFTMQYVHARCCSLVLLAHREGLIQLREPLPNTSPVFWQLLPQESIPWLNHDQQLRLHHPTEEHLIAQLVQIVDDLVCSDVGDVIKWQKVSWELSQAWESFWSQCRIWGEVKISSVELAQARLGLVMATQQLLQLWLVAKLGVYAPLEL